MDDEIPDGYRMTELGALPEEWEAIKCENLFRLTSGLAKTQKEIATESTKGKIPVYGGNGITGFTLNPLITHETIVIGRVGEYCGTVHLSLTPCWVTDNALYIKKFENNIHIKYLFCSLNYFDISRLKNQTGQPLISQQPIYNLTIPLPPLPEQSSIATILSTLDETAEHTEALIEKYKNIKAGLMSDLLTRGIDEEGRIRSKGTHRFKDSALGRVPEEWEITFLGKCCKNITDGSHFSPLPTKDGPKIANVKDIFGKNINIKSCTSISREDFIKLEKGGCSPNRGDVLLSKDGTIGKTLVYEQDEKIVLLSSIAIIKPKDDLNSYFLHNILKSFYFDKQMLILISGSALRRIVLRDINLIQIPLPPLSEQRRIAEILTAADQRIEKEETYRDKLLQLKKGLMQDLLTGKVRVKVPQN